MQGTGQGHYPWPTWRLSYDSQYSPSFAFIPPDQYSLPSQPASASVTGPGVTLADSQRELESFSPYSPPSTPETVSDGHESPQSSPTVIEPTDDGTDTVTAAANQVSGR